MNSKSLTCFLAPLGLLFALTMIGSESCVAQDNLWIRKGVDWPRFLGPRGTGVTTETGLRFNWTEDPPAKKWELDVGEGYGMGVVSRGRYFHFDRVSDNARLRAVHAETGESLWEFTYPTDYEDIYGFDGGPRSSPVVDGQHVYVFGVEGILICLNAETGEKIWEVDTAEEFGVIQNFFGVGSSPLVFGELLIVMVGGSPDESQAVPRGQLDRVRPNGTGIVAFDKLTGEIRYQTIDDLASYSSPIVVEMNQQKIGLAFCRSGLFVFDPATGIQVSEFPFRARKFESVNASTPVVADSKIVLTESYGLGGVCLQWSDEKLEPVWQDRNLRDAALACHWNTPVIVGDHLFASSGEKRSTAELNCVRLADGQVTWRQPGLTRSSLTLADEHLVCVTEQGEILCLRPNPEKFELVSSIPASHSELKYPCWAAPVVSHGYLWVRGKSRVVCFDIRDKE